MSAEEETELRDLIIDSLEKKGVLAKIKAELRASVFLALEETENEKYKIPLSNEAIQKLQETKNGRMALFLVRDFLEYFRLDYTLAVLDAEISPFTAIMNKNDLEKDLNLGPNINEPLLMRLLQNKSTPPRFNELPGNVPGEKNVDWKNEMNIFQTNTKSNSNNTYLLNDVVNANSGADDPFFDEPVSARKEPFSFSFSDNMHDHSKTPVTRNTTHHLEKNENAEAQGIPKNVTIRGHSEMSSSEDDILSNLLEKKFGKPNTLAAEPTSQSFGTSMSSLKDLPSLNVKTKESTKSNWLDHFDILHAAAFNCGHDDYEDDFQSSESLKSGSKQQGKKNGSNSKDNTDGSIEEDIEEDISIPADDLLNTSGASLGEENDATSDRSISHLSGAGGFDYMEKLSS